MQIQISIQYIGSTKNHRNILQHRWAERTYGFEFLRNFSAMDQIFLEEFKLKDHFPRSLKDGFPVLSDLVQAQDTAVRF